MRLVPRFATDRIFDRLRFGHTCLNITFVLIAPTAIGQVGAVQLSQTRLPHIAQTVIPEPYVIEPGAMTDRNTRAMIGRISSVAIRRHSSVARGGDAHPNADDLDTPTETVRRKTSRCHSIQLQTSPVFLVLTAGEEIRLQWRLLRPRAQGSAI